MSAPPQAQAHNFAMAILTDISDTLLLHPSNAGLVARGHFLGPETQKKH
jgi:hypothetical protein